MKSRKIMMIGVSIAMVLCIVGCTVKQKEDTKQDKTNVSSSIKEDKKPLNKNSSLFSRNMSKKSSIL